MPPPPTSPRPLCSPMPTPRPGTRAPPTLPTPDRAPASRPKRSTTAAPNPRRTAVAQRRLPPPTTRPILALIASPVTASAVRQVTAQTTTVTAARTMFALTVRPVTVPAVRQVTPPTTTATAARTMLALTASPVTAPAVQQVTARTTTVTAARTMLAQTVRSAIPLTVRRTTVRTDRRTTVLTVRRTTTPIVQWTTSRTIVRAIAPIARPTSGMRPSAAVMRTRPIIVPSAIVATRTTMIAAGRMTGAVATSGIAVRVPVSTSVRIGDVVARGRGRRVVGPPIGATRGRTSPICPRTCRPPIWIRPCAAIC